MTNEQAYVVLENCASLLDSGTRFFTEDHTKQFREAYELAMKALRKTERKTGKWIPCSERPPRYDETEETSEYLVTDKGGRVRHCYLDPYMPETFVTVEEGMLIKAVAWMPLPEPWKGEAE